MKTMVFALMLSFGGAAFACDCQKKQAEKKEQACDCPGQSCPGECPGMDKAPGNKTDKKTDKKKS